MEIRSLITAFSQGSPEYAHSSVPMCTFRFAFLLVISSNLLSACLLWKAHPHECSGHAAFPAPNSWTNTRVSAMFIFNTNIASVRNGYQSSNRSTGEKDPPFPNESPNHRAKEHIKLPFALWALDSQLLCSVAQLQQRGRGCPLGREAHSLVVRTPSWAARGLDLNSLRLRVPLNLHIKLPWTNTIFERLLSLWMWRTASILIIFYKERVLQNKGGAGNITKLSKVELMKVFQALLAMSIGEKTYRKRNSKTKKGDF